MNTIIAHCKYLQICCFFRIVKFGVSRIEAQATFDELLTTNAAYKKCLAESCNCISGDY
jgi:hypothetical protein